MQALYEIQRRHHDVRGLIAPSSLEPELHKATQRCEIKTWRVGELTQRPTDHTVALVAQGLATIAQPTDDLGRVVTNCLLERLRGVRLATRQTLLPGSLIVRAPSRRAPRPVALAEG